MVSLQLIIIFPVTGSFYFIFFLLLLLLHAFVVWVPKSSVLIYFINFDVIYVDLWTVGFSSVVLYSNIMVTFFFFGFFLNISVCILVVYIYVEWYSSKSMSHYKKNRTVPNCWSWAWKLCSFIQESFCVCVRLYVGVYLGFNFEAHKQNN